MGMRAGLYQQKNGLLVFFGSLRSSQSMTCEEISSSTVSNVRASADQFVAARLFVAVPSGEIIHRTGRGAAMQMPCSGVISPGVGGMPGIGTIFIGGNDSLLVRAAV